MDAPTVKALILVSVLVCTSSLPTKYDTAAKDSTQQHRGGPSHSSSTDGDELWAAHTTRKRSAVPPSLDVLWPSGKVPYVFDGRVAHENILKAMDLITNVTCIEFVPRTAETVYVNFTLDPQSCNTPRGRNPYLSFLPTYRGQQVLLTPVCANSTGTVVNLLGTTLGLWAEHLRPDRDSYVTVLWDVIVPSRRPNFYINPNIDTSYGPYDLGSIMHYSLNAESRNGSNTMELNVAYDGVVGQRERLSSWDISKIRRMYGCPVGTATHAPSSSSSSSSSSSFSSPTITSSVSPTIPSTLEVSPPQEITMETSTVPTSVADNSSNGSHPDRDVIRSGSQIALKLLAKEGDAHLWLGCTGTACMASECPGPTFIPERTVLCQEYIYLVKLANTGVRLYEDDVLRTGDQVVLMQLGGSTLYCNQTTFSCMMLPDCRDKSGKFSGELCGNAVRWIDGDGETGQVICNGIYIMLDCMVKSVPLLAWKDTLYCHPKDEGHCERRYCSDASMLDQYMPDGHYDNGCRLIYTIVKLPS